MINNVNNTFVHYTIYLFTIFNCDGLMLSILSVLMEKETIIGGNAFYFFDIRLLILINFYVEYTTC